MNTAKDLTSLDDVIALMESSSSDQEWDDNCDRVKEANHGNYPGFWFRAIVLSGLAKRVTAKWGGDAEIHVSVLR